MTQSLPKIEVSTPQKFSDSVDDAWKLELSSREFFTFVHVIKLCHMTLPYMVYKIIDRKASDM